MAWLWELKPSIIFDIIHIVRHVCLFFLSLLRLARYTPAPA